MTTPKLRDVPHDVTTGLRRRLSRALRDRVAGQDAERRAHAIWLAPGERRFEPDSPICRVHGHAGMYSGGIRALLLQSLHPLAMAGVGEHSGYRGDPWGRLQRTSEFIAMTTYGPVEAAQAMVDRINRVHHTVRGATRDGRPYAATDPHLLTWVHVAEVDSFLVAHQRYSRTPLSPAEADTYVDQTAWVATELGVPDPPRTVASLRDRLESFRPELETSDGALDVVRFLLLEPPLPWASRPGLWMLAAGALETLPGYARDLLHLRLPYPLRGLEAVALRWIAGPLGAAATTTVAWALGAADEPQHRRGACATPSRLAVERKT